MMNEDFLYKLFYFFLGLCFFFMIMKQWDDTNLCLSRIAKSLENPPEITANVQPSPLLIDTIPERALNKKGAP